MKIKNVMMIEESDWNELVQKTYGRPYDFQQQEDCRDRGTYDLIVPCPNAEDYTTNEVPEIVNHSEMGVSFAAWLARDPNKPLNDNNNCESWEIKLWWERNFYPSIEMIANDLHAKGLLKEGKYIINIDW